MATTEQTIGIDQHQGSTLMDQTRDEAAKPSKFIFDVALSTAIAANGKGEAAAPVPKGPLTPEMLDKMNRYWRAPRIIFALARSTSLKTRCCGSRSKRNRSNQGCSGTGGLHRDKTSSTFI
jgi:hypothetical protein